MNSTVVKMLILLGLIYFLTRRLLKPFRDFKKQMKQSPPPRNEQRDKEKNSPITDDLGDYIDYEEIK